jgi:hypothetical protein
VDGDKSSGEEGRGVGRSLGVSARSRRGRSWNKKGEGDEVSKETSAECVFVIRASGAAEAGTQFLGFIGSGDESFDGPEMAGGASGSSSSVV